MTTLKNQASLLERHIDDVVRRYERDKKEGKKAMTEIENDFNGALGLLALRLATQAQVDKILADHLLSEIRKRIYDEQELARQERPLNVAAVREAKGQTVEALNIKRAKKAKERKDSKKNYLED